MWPFKRQWKPTYLEDVIARVSSTNLSLRRTSSTVWGELDKEPCARYGVEALMGMVTTYCGEYFCDHWWCYPEPEGGLFMLAEIYYAKDTDQSGTLTGMDHIGAYLWEVKEITEHENGFGFLGGEAPVEKVAIQPLKDGSTLACKGRIYFREGSSSPGNQGVIDPDTASEIRSYPRRVNNIPEDNTPQWSVFVLGLNNGKWNIGRCVQIGAHEWYGGTPFAQIDAEPGRR